MKYMVICRGNVYEHIKKSYEDNWTGTKIANKRGVTVQDAWNDAMKEYKEKYEYVA